MIRDPSSLSIAVVGAGFAGLHAARYLRDSGCDVQVVDKARGPGGRMSTRREEGFEFDHGAQYFTARDAAFRQAIEEWRERGMVQAWSGRIVHLTRGEVRPDQREGDRFVAVPRMNSLCRALSDSLRVVYDLPVTRIARAGDGWDLYSGDGHPIGRYDCVLVTTPPAQAVALLEAAPDLAARLSLVEMHPCWAIILIPERRLDVEWDAALVHESPLSWVARTSSKPGRPPIDAWVLHASPQWSAAHMDVDADTVGESLTGALFEAAGVAPQAIDFRNAHRWRYAKTVTPLGVDHLLESGIGVCGDWCRGDRVEDAYLSGLSLARAVIGTA